MKAFLHNKSFYAILITLLAVALAIPVLADYLGPNRTVTETVHIYGERIMTLAEIFHKLTAFQAGQIPCRAVK